MNFLIEPIKECEQEASAIRAAIDVRRAHADRLAELGFNSDALLVRGLTDLLGDLLKRPGALIQRALISPLTNQRRFN